MKADMVELNLSLSGGGQGNGVGALGHLGLRVEHFIDALCGGKPVRPVVGELGHHGEGLKRGHQVVRKGDDLSESEVPTDGLKAPQPHDEHDADVDEQCEDRAHGSHELHDLNVFPGEIRVGLTEAFRLVLSPHEGLDEARPRDILLQDGVQAVQSLLDDSKERLEPCAEEDNHDTADDEDGHHAQRKGSARHEHEHDAPDHRERRPRADAQRHLKHALYRRRVARQAHHELGGREPVDIAVGEVLYFDEDRLAQVPRDVLSDPDRGDAVQHGDEGGEQRYAQHDGRRRYHDGQILLADASVDNEAHESRHREIEYDHREQHHKGKEREFPVWPGKVQEFFEFVHGVLLRAQAERKVFFSMSMARRTVSLSPGPMALIFPRM